MIKVPLETLAHLYAIYGKPASQPKLGKKGSKNRHAVLLPPPLVVQMCEDCILEISHLELEHLQLQHPLELPHVQELHLQCWRYDLGGPPCDLRFNLVHRATILRISLNETTRFCGAIAGVFGPIAEQLMLVVKMAEVAAAYLKTIRCLHRHANLNFCVICIEELAAEDIKQLRATGLALPMLKKRFMSETVRKWTGKGGRSCSLNTRKLAMQKG